MNHMPVVLDISSDEESGLEEQSENLDFGRIKEFLGMSDGESGDSDEVVVVREVIPERRAKCSKPIVKYVDDDDDCMVLNGDPENGVTSVNEEETESDELQIVGEKGQIACRDYPHARHLCATFPFSSTPHEKHCDQCHCYVCDSLAPCLKWGTGISSTDHCHATDKVEMWKIQRTNAKLGMSSLLPASTNYGTSPCVAYTQQDQAAQHDIIQLYSNSISNQLSRPVAIRPCSTLIPIQDQVCGPTIMRAQSDLSSQNYTMQNQMSRCNTFPVSSSNTNFTVPFGTRHGRRQELESPLARNRYQPQVPNQSLGVRNNVIRRDRGCNAGPQFIRSHTVARRVGIVGDTPTLDHSTHVSSGYSNHVNLAVQNERFCGASGLSNDRNRSAWDTFLSPNLTSPVEQNDRYHAAIGISNDRNCNGWDACANPNLPSYSHTISSQPNRGGVNENIVPSETPTFSQPLSQPNNSQNFYQSCFQGNEAQANYESCPSNSHLGNEHQIGMQSEYATESIIHCGNASQDACQQKPQQENQSEIAKKEKYSLFDLGWSIDDWPPVENTNQSSEPLVASQDACQQKPQQENQSEIARKAKYSLFDLAWSIDDCLPVENANQSSEPLVSSFHLPCSGSIHQPLNVEESDMQHAGNINSSTLDEFRTWFLEKDSVPGVPDAAVPSELSSIQSPDRYPIDAG